MTAYRLHWKKQPPGLIDGSGLRPDRLCGLSIDELAKESIRYGRRRYDLGELFDVESLPGEEEAALYIPGSERFVGLGEGMVSGTLEIDGPAGEGVARGMTGGCVRVLGSAGNLAGAGMAGGVLVVEGDVGEMAGGPGPGELRGMTGGELLVHGNAGGYAGSRQRSGLIAVRGRVGECPAYKMLAGTLLVCEGELAAAGFGMGRGTIIGLSAQPKVLPTFRRDGFVQPVVLRLLWRRLNALGFPLPAGLDDARFVSFSGDLLSLHRGELLLRHSG